METWELQRPTDEQEAFIREWLRGAFGCTIQRCGDTLLISCYEPSLEDELVGLCEENGIECRLL